MVDAVNIASLCCFAEEAVIFPDQRHGFVKERILTWSVVKSDGNNCIQVKTCSGCFCSISLTASQGKKTEGSQYKTK